MFPYCLKSKPCITTHSKKINLQQFLVWLRYKARDSSPTFFFLFLAVFIAATQQSLKLIDLGLKGVQRHIKSESSVTNSKIESNFQYN